MDGLPDDHDKLVPHVKKKMGGKAQGMRPHARMDKQPRHMPKHDGSPAKASK